MNKFCCMLVFFLLVVCGNAYTDPTPRELYDSLPPECKSKNIEIPGGLENPNDLGYENRNLPSLEDYFLSPMIVVSYNKTGKQYDNSFGSSIFIGLNKNTVYYMTARHVVSSILMGGMSSSDLQKYYQNKKKHSYLGFNLSYNESMNVIPSSFQYVINERNSFHICPFPIITKDYPKVIRAQLSLIIGDDNYYGGFGGLRAMEDKDWVMLEFIIEPADVNFFIHNINKYRVSMNELPQTIPNKNEVAFFSDKKIYNTGWPSIGFHGYNKMIAAGMLTLSWGGGIEYDDNPVFVLARNMHDIDMSGSSGGPCYYVEFNSYRWGLATKKFLFGMMVAGKINAGTADCIAFKNGTPFYNNFYAIRSASYKGVAE